MFSSEINYWGGGVQGKVAEGKVRGQTFGEMDWGDQSLKGLIRNSLVQDGSGTDIAQIDPG